MLGPVDFIVVRFPGTALSAEVASGLAQLVESGTVRVIDLLFVTKDAHGEVSYRELSDLDDASYAGWDAIVSDVAGYLTPDDASLLAESLPPGSSAVLTLIENAWAQEMVRTIAAAQGEVMISERLPRLIVDELIAQHDAAAD